MANLTPILANSLGLYFQLANGAWASWELGARDGSSPAESHDTAAVSASRTYLCNWTQRGNAVTWFVGDQALETGNVATTNITRRLPQPFPNGQVNSSANRMIATSVRISGHQAIGQTGNGNATSGTDIGDLTLANAYTMAKLEVTYTLQLYRADIPDAFLGVFQEYDRYVSQSETRSATAYQTMLAGMMKFANATGTGASNQSVAFSTGIVLPWEEVPITWYAVPYEAWGSGKALTQRVYGNGTSIPYLGCVNNQTFFNYPVGTILFESVRAVQEAAPAGEYGGNRPDGNQTTGWQWRLEYGFKYDPNGWLNKYYFEPCITQRSDKNGWYFLGIGNANGTISYYTAANVPDYYGQYNARNLYNLFIVANLTPGP